MLDAVLEFIYTDQCPSVEGECGCVRVCMCVILFVWRCEGMRVCV